MAFDADTFMNAVTSEANDTKIIPTPVGEYVGSITKVEGAAGTSDRTGTDWAKLNITVAIEGDPTIKQVTGLDKKLITGGLMLDLTDNGGIAVGPGKNIRLGKLRDALGQNRPGQPWSPKMMEGLTVKIKVGHRPDKNDPSVLYDDITGWLPA